MNTGLQDAFNLGWKLALVCRGEAGAGLLDTYEAERRPVAERVVASGADAESRAGDDRRRRARRARRRDPPDVRRPGHRAPRGRRRRRARPLVPEVAGGRRRRRHGAATPGRRLPDTAPVEPVQRRCRGRSTSSPTVRATRCSSSAGREADPGRVGASSPSSRRARRRAPSTPSSASAPSRGRRARVGRIDESVAAQLGVDGVTVLAVRPDRYVGLRDDGGDPRRCGHTSTRWSRSRSADLSAARRPSRAPGHRLRGAAGPVGPSPHCRRPAAPTHCPDRTASATSSPASGLRDGRETTVYLVKHPPRRPLVRVLCFADPRRLDHWCAEHGHPEAMVAGFFVRDPYRPLGEVRHRRRARGARAGGRLPGARGAPVSTWTATSVSAQRGACRPTRRATSDGRADARQRRPLLDGRRGPGGLFGRPTQFDSDITTGRHPRCALGLTRRAPGGVLRWAAVRRGRRAQLASSRDC